MEIPRYEQSGQGYGVHPERERERERKRDENEGMGKGKVPPYQSTPRDKENRESRQLPNDMNSWNVLWLIDLLVLIDNH